MSGALTDIQYTMDFYRYLGGWTDRQHARLTALNTSLHERG